MHIQWKTPRCLRYGAKALTYEATMHKLKSMFFSQLTLLSHNPILTSYLSRINVIFESSYSNHSFLGYGMECWKHRRKEENRQKKNTEKWRERKNEEHEEIQITTIYIFGFKLHFARKHKKLFILSNFIYSFYAFQYIWNIVMIMYIIVRINIQIII